MASNGDRNLITGFNHTSFTVSDLEKSLLFYRDLLGMPLISLKERPLGFCEKVTGISGAHLKIAYLEAWGHKMELIQYLSPRGQKLNMRTCDVGSAHIAFNVDNLENMYHEMAAKGVKFRSKPMMIPAGPNKGGLTVYLEDPDGITIELIQPKTKNREWRKR